MPTPIIYQDQSGAITYRVTGEVSDENVVSLHLTLVDGDGEVRGSGDLRFPLDRARTSREVLGRVIRNQVEAVHPTKAYTVEEKRAAAPKAYAPWTGDEEALLLRLFDAGTPPEEVSRQLGRNYGSLGSRLAKLGRIEDYRTYGQPT